ncbi:MAG: hypothetical protein JSV80_14275, partial [Acidobacteriota bacterium]
TIEEVARTGIQIYCEGGAGESYGNKLFDNAVHNAQFDGMNLTEFCDDHLVVRNVVTHCIFDGIKIGGDFNYIFQNHITSNFISGGSFGLVFLATADGNSYSQNMARNNNVDFADFGGGFYPNSSFVDNMIAGPPPM